MKLENLRKQIDNLDQSIIRLLSERAKIIVNVAKVKIKEGKSIYSPDREREVLNKIQALNNGPLTNDGLVAIYREIMSSSLALEKPLKIAYLGPEASFTHLAAMKRFGSQVEYVAVETITDVFLEVERGWADYGVVPIENSFEGVINHTLDMFMDSELKICSQITLDVTHNLLGRFAKDKIKRVYSKAEVFGQCRLWLKENLPKAVQTEVSSTTRGAQLAAKEKDCACIGSSLAARVYKLRVIESDIEDSPHNITRFLVIGRTEAGKTGHDRTSIMFSIKDKVGALHEMLMPFKKYRINLTKIESRPSKKKAWDYYFFVDLEGHVIDPFVKKALRELDTKCKFMKVLGSYPVGA